MRYLSLHSFISVWGFLITLFLSSFIIFIGVVSLVLIMLDIIFEYLKSLFNFNE